MSDMFEIVRKDGRSNSQVILDHVKGHEPGRTYPYKEFAKALQEGTDRVYDQKAVVSVVRGAFRRLLVEQQRTLYNLRGVGYRLAHGKEHNQLALVKKHRADSQMLRGLAILKDVRLEEMNRNERHAHEATLMLVSALWQNQKSLERRQTEVENALANLTRKVEGGLADTSLGEESKTA